MRAVSVIVPIFNEEKSIGNCIKSILEQDYSKENMQVIFVDGMSEDNTREIVKEYIERYPQIFRLMDNPKRIAPVAMNIGINVAEGKYIIRLDAHSEYPPNYISECIHTLENIEADNVGGLALSKGSGTVGEAYAQVLSSKFGVGNSGFRTGASSGYVDTVPFGAFKRETFDKYGTYDERLIRNQDYELNFRIRKNGGRIYLNSNIKLYYHCKNTFNAIAKQSFENGKWNVITMKLCPGSMGLRHFIPFIFLCSLIGLTLASLVFKPFLYILGLELILYMFCNLIFSLKNDEKRYKNRALTKLFLFPLFHCSYGMGSMIGLLNLRRFT